MALLESASEIASGIVGALFVFVLFATGIYRLLAGRFILPKRQVILPNQTAVVVKGDRTIRVAGPGGCWVRPGQSLVPCDMRPRPLQMVALEVLTSDLGIVRISLNGSYKISDPATYYVSSAHTADEIHIQLRRIVSTSGRSLAKMTLINDPDSFATLIRDKLASEAAKLGLEVTELAIWESIDMGFVRYAKTEDAPPATSAGGLVH
jgi:regulator of protease activity HflC (stomatin/prohibitin superfamily)